MALYDVLNLRQTSFTKREADAAISTNPSPGAARSTASASKTSIGNGGETVKTKFSASAEQDGDREYSYRYTNKESPMSEWGHAMFADDQDASVVYGRENQYRYKVDRAKLTDISSLRQEEERGCEFHCSLLKNIKEAAG